MRQYLVDEFPDKVKISNNMDEMAKISDVETSIRESDAHQTLQDYLIASEVAYAQGHFANAVSAMRSAVKLIPGDAALRFRLGLFLVYAEALEEAESVLQYAINIDPQCEGAYQSLIQLSVKKQNVGAAIKFCKEQIRRCGQTNDLNAQLMTLLLLDKRSGEALGFIEKINVASDVPLIGNLRVEAELCFRIGRTEQAIRAATAAVRVAPDDVNSYIFMAGFLCAAGRFSEAAQPLEQALEFDPENVEARTMLAACQSESGDYRNALFTTLALIQRDPKSQRHWTLAATLAKHLGYGKSATEFFSLAHKIEPKNIEVAVALANSLATNSKYEEAVDVLDDAAKNAPNNCDIQNLRLQYLTQLNTEQSRNAVGTIYVGPMPQLSAQQRQRWERTATAGFGGFLQSLRLKYRVIVALMMRELSHRSAQSKLGIASNLVEPVLQIAFLGFVLSLFNHGRPPLGDKLFFFYATGVVPFYLFLHVINYCLNTFSDNRALLQVPLISQVDLVVSTALTEFLIATGTATIIFLGFSIVGQAQRTDNIAQAVLAFFATFLLAFGVGFLLAVLNMFYKTVSVVWQSFQRLLYIASGVFFLPQSMPDWIREPLTWNPLLHSIEWFRVGFFPQYAPPWLDQTYLIGMGLALTLLAAMLHKSLASRVALT